MRNAYVVTRDVFRNYPISDVLSTHERMLCLFENPRLEQDRNNLERSHCEAVDHSNRHMPCQDRILGVALAAEMAILYSTRWQTEVSSPS